MIAEGGLDKVFVAFRSMGSGYRVNDGILPCILPWIYRYIILDKKVQVSGRKDRPVYGVLSTQETLIDGNRFSSKMREYFSLIAAGIDTFLGAKMDGWGLEVGLFGPFLFFFPCSTQDCLCVCGCFREQE